MKDAALCVEQGARWLQTISQNFDTIANSLITLFEISTTEGWVDVMYEAVDAKGGYYQQPKRDQQIIWAFAFIAFIFFSNMFFLNLSVGVIVEQFLNIKKMAKMVNDEGAQVYEDGLGCYYCSRPLSQDRTVPAKGSSSSLDKKGLKCSAEMQCQSCINFTPDPTLLMTAQQAQWLASRKTLHGRTEPFQLTNLHQKPKRQKQAFLIITSPYFENLIMLAIVLNTLLMACQAFPQPTDWWDEFKMVAGYTFAFIFFLEFLVKIYALRNNYRKDPWNLFDFFCVIATFVGILLNWAGISLGAVMSVIRIFRVARLFRLLRFMKGVNKIFMALVYSLPKLANVSFLLVLLLILFGILGVQLFAKNKLSGSLDSHGNFQDFPRAFITLFRAMTGEAWNEMMHDLSKDEKDYLLGPKISDERSWCSPASLWDTDSVDTFRILKDKCMIAHPNQCREYAFTAEIYFVGFCLIITFMVLNLVIAVILEGYQDGKEHCEGEVIDVCIKMWKKYDDNYTMFIPFLDAFRYADEVIHKVGDGPRHEELAQPSLRPSPTCAFGVDLASVPMKYAQAFDLQMTEGGEVHFIHVVKLVLRLLASGNDPQMLKHIQATDDLLSKKDKAKLERMESKQLLKNNAHFLSESDNCDLRKQVAASKIQRRFKARQARRKAAQDIERRFGCSPCSPCNPCQEPEPDSLAAESVTSTPATGGETVEAASAMPVEMLGTSTAASASSVPMRHMEPRSPANVDGLDEPGRWRMMNSSLTASSLVEPARFDSLRESPPGVVERIREDDQVSDKLVLNPPPGG
jgi:hypothetical protein